MSEGLQKIHITGFGSLAELELNPGRLTVLIGANGVGKSNILRALQMVAMMRTGSLQRFVGESGGATELLHYGPKQTQTININLEFSQQDKRNTYEARLGFAAGDRLMYLDERVGYQPSAQAQMSTTSINTGTWESTIREDQDVTAKTVNYWLSQLTFFHFHDTSQSSALRTYANAQDDRYLRSNGSNLAAYLYKLSVSEEDADRVAWRRINQHIKRIAPSIKELSPALIERSSKVRLDWIDDRDERFGVAQLSDGTLRAIALITALAQPTRQLPKLISIDEPELGLHPYAIHVIAELARSISRHTQLIFATQSTELLNHFEPHEIVVVERHQNASTLRRLDQEGLSGWLEDYTLSELFNKGIIGGRP